MHPTLTLNGLEAVYDCLAETLDQAPPEKSELLLAKLALLLAQDLGDADRFAALAQAALQDL
ncbi:MAG: DUF2783 domain-containing protein [Burkholderiales bacterium RIFCSPHIGHO2_12_FULL_69_20]|nr:MAG: DUF2783 domain-containing protein [Burkholderiales bacterium RIFCSPHIGHO2_12_FULL_69_20]